MRIEITQELDAADPSLEIPWAGSCRSRLNYVDLKRHPEWIVKLPESRRFPPLSAFLRRVNSPGSRLRTAKCDAWTTRKLAQDERLDFNLPCKAGSYVDVVFDGPRCHTRLDAHRKFAERVSRALASFRVRGQMDIVVRRCLFHPREEWGYALTFFVHGYGATRTEAIRAWSSALSSLGNALTQRSKSAGPGVASASHSRRD
jgi:hypothetical protein